VVPTPSVMEGASQDGLVPDGLHPPCSRQGGELDGTLREEQGGATLEGLGLRKKTTTRTRTETRTRTRRDTRHTHCYNYRPTLPPTLPPTRPPCHLRASTLVAPRPPIATCVQARWWLSSYPPHARHTTHTPPQHTDTQHATTTHNTLLQHTTLQRRRPSLCTPVAEMDYI
jgi:hypothetical protein